MQLFVFGADGHLRLYQSAPEALTEARTGPGQQAQQAQAQRQPQPHQPQPNPTKQTKGLKLELCVATRGPEMPHKHAQHQSILEQPGLHAVLQPCASLDTRQSWAFHGDAPGTPNGGGYLEYGDCANYLGIITAGQT
jgi:hypothetical protein